MKMLSYLFLAIFLITGTAMAADFPTKPITHIVPAKAGGGFDRSSRVLALGWEKILDQPVNLTMHQVHRA